MNKHIICIFIAANLLFACNPKTKENIQNKPSYNTKEQAEVSHNDEEDSHDNEIVFTQEQAESAGLQVETITEGTFRQVIKASGQIQSTQGNEHTIVATTNGIVSFANSSITEGIEVKAGERFVIISAQEILDGDPNVKAGIVYRTALEEYQRAQNLSKDTIISAKEFARIRMYYETAKTAYEAQASKLADKGVKVTAPSSGYIKELYIKQGEYVNVGQTIAVLSQNRQVQLRADVPEKYFSALKDIGDANFKMAYDSHIYRLADLNGRLISFGKSTDPQSAYIPITFEFNNVDNIIPGSFAEVYLLSKPMEKVITVPVSALTEEQGLYFVYLQSDVDEYKKQEVQQGGNNGERVLISFGLKEGDKVVTKGVYQIKLAATSSKIPEGHTH